MIPQHSYEKLTRTFHEPARLGIMTCLASHADGRSFTELKSECGLTDGNLNRHLNVLREEAFITIDKSRARQTQVQCTTDGLESFLSYLDELEKIVRTAVRTTRLRIKS